MLINSSRMETTAYIKEGACVLQDQLVGIRLVFTVGDIHLKFVCLKRTKTVIGKHVGVAPFCPLCLTGSEWTLQLNLQTQGLDFP